MEFRKIKPLRLALYCVLITSLILAFLIFTWTEHKSSIRYYNPERTLVPEYYPPHYQNEIGRAHIKDLSPMTHAALTESVWQPEDKSKSIQTAGQSNTTEALISPLLYTKMKFGSAHILRAAVVSSSPSSSWDVIRIYTSMDISLRSAKIRCCFRFTGSQKGEYMYFESQASTFKSPIKEARLTALLHACRNIRPGTIPDGVGITVNKFSCEERHVTYIQPYIPKVPKTGTTLALCNKGVFGTIKAELIIEWMETYRYLGVDKVVSYVLKDLNENARRVLLYYSAIGFVELFDYHPALEGSLYRSFHPSDRQSLNDRQVTVFDAHERFSGYTYFGVMDHDEFLIPSRNRSLKQLMDDLYKAYPNAAGFSFRVQPFFISWGANGTENDLIIGRHITRTLAKPVSEPTFQKNIYQPNYIQEGGTHTHRPKPITGKDMVVVPAAEGYISHFRNKCYNTSCEQHWKRTTDTWLSKWSSRIENNVLEVRKRIFGSENPIP